MAGSKLSGDDDDGVIMVPSGELSINSIWSSFGVPIISSPLVCMLRGSIVSGKGCKFSPGHGVFLLMEFEYGDKLQEKCIVSFCEEAICWSSSLRRARSSSDGNQPYRSDSSRLPNKQTWRSLLEWVCGAVVSSVIALELSQSDPECWGK